MRSFARVGRMTAIMAGVAAVAFGGRMLWVNGLFSSVPTGFLGACKVLAGVPGVQDIEIVNGTAFIAASSARGPSEADGIYALPLAGGTLTKLAGAPKDFHPRGIGTFRSPDGSGVFLLAVNRRNTGRFSVDSFEVTNAKTAPALVSQGTIGGGLLTDPQDVVAAGPSAFYVSNNSLKQPFLRSLAGWGVIPGSEILYFNGMLFRKAVEDVYGARGLLLTPDDHLLVASLTTRSINAFSREPVTGNLTEGKSLTLDAAPDRISLDNRGEVWVAGHANLFHWRGFGADKTARIASQVFRVSLSSGEPQEAQQVYGNDGKEIAGASAAASLGKRLLIGSSLDEKLLDCTQN
jgi:arylesterase / paraoxonase